MTLAKETKTPSEDGVISPISLLVVVDGKIGRSHPIEDGENLIGRWDPEAVSYPEIDLTHDDPEIKISRKHALVRRDNDSLSLEDIGSRNGTFLKDGMKLEPGNIVTLNDGDEFVVGKTVLRVKFE